MVDGLDRLPLFLASHCRPVHDGAADREGAMIPFIADPDDIALADFGIGIDDSWRHDIRAVVDMRYSAHVYGDVAPPRGISEESSDGRGNVVAQQEANRLGANDQETGLSRVRLVDMGLVARHLHAEIGRESGEMAGDLLPAQSRPMADLRGHAITKRP